MKNRTTKRQTSQAKYNRMMFLAWKQYSSKVDELWSAFQQQKACALNEFMRVMDKTNVDFKRNTETPFKEFCRACDVARNVFDTFMVPVRERIDQMEAEALKKYPGVSVDAWHVEYSKLQLAELGELNLVKFEVSKVPVMLWTEKEKQTYIKTGVVP